METTEKYRIAIQGELGSNSHMAAVALLGGVQIVSCAMSPQVFDRLEGGEADAAVLPIENSLHGSVAEHYDLLLEHAVRVDAESLLRIEHNVIAAPGVTLGEIRRVFSHPVALSQCRRWLAAHPEIEVVPAYDTAGSVKMVVEARSRDTAGIAPMLAAREYDGEVLVKNVEDHAENFTRFYLLRAKDTQSLATPTGAANKMILAFSVDHRPGTLVAVLAILARAGLDLTRIESRPVISRPWEYSFYVDVRFERAEQADRALTGLGPYCRRLKVLGRFRAA